MLKRLVNEAVFPLTIENLGPLLIKSGYAEVSGCDMEPVQTYRNGQLECYIPGSSLKGVLRNHFEKIARTLNNKAGVVCDPFHKPNFSGGNGTPITCERYEEVSCGNKFQLLKKEKSANYKNLDPINPVDENKYVYENSCPACRLFGSTFFIGRFCITDGYLRHGSKVNLKKRDLVGIDRLTGGAYSGAKFDLKAVSAGAEFETKIYLRNFECWQLGAVFILLDDMKEKHIRLGYGTTRGFGEITCDFDQVSISRIGRFNKDQKEIAGLGKILEDGSYGTFIDDFLTLDSMPEPEVKGIRTVWGFDKNSYIEDLKSVAAAEFVKRIESWPDHKEMQWDHKRWSVADE
jgi:CRISPR-associated RAMP protein (TIGR02581 family)